MPWKSKSFWAAILGLWALALLLPRSRGVAPGRGHPNWPPNNFAVYYGRWDHEKLRAARQYELLIVHPGKGMEALNADIVRRLRYGPDQQPQTPDDTVVLVYLSIGEDENPPRGPGHRSRRYLDRRKLVMEGGFPKRGADGLPIVEDGPDGIPDRNGAWGSYYVNPGDEDWRRLVQARAQRLSELGVDGFFLDTIDSASGIYADLQPAMLQLVASLRTQFPKLYLVANRGVEVLQREPDRFVESVDGIVLESWFTHWDWTLGKAVVSPFAQENARLLRDVLEPRPKLHRLYLDYLDPKQPDRGALLARRRGYDPGFWSHPFLQSLDPLPIGPARTLAPPTPGACARTPEGLLQMDLPGAESCEVVAVQNGLETSLPTVGAPRPARWAVGDSGSVKIRSVDLDGNSSEWLEVAVPPAARPAWTLGWNVLELQDELRISWEGPPAVVWRGKDPWSLRPSTVQGSSPLTVDGLGSAELVWLALAAPGGTPGLARPARTRDVTAPPEPARAKARYASGRLTVLWEPVEADDLVGYRIYVTEPGKPLALPYEVGKQENFEVQLPLAEYEVKITSYDNGNHESTPCLAPLER
jgi:hypothetical protein